MPNDTSSPAQTQSQRQEQTVTINVNNSGNPGLEYSILSKHGVGRQLGSLAAVVDVLLAAHQADPGFAQTPEARAAIDAFMGMQKDIAGEKRRHAPEALIIGQLEALRGDRQAFAAACARLRGWLDGQQGAAGGNP